MRAVDVLFVARRARNWIALELGAYEALNLDGGGSTTMVVSDGGKARVVNAPIHKRIPMWERPVGNHLGVLLPPDVSVSD